MFILERLAALAPGLLVLAAGTSLLLSAMRAEVRSVLAVQRGRGIGDAMQVMQGLLDRRAPGASIRPTAGGVAVRVARAEGVRCGSDGAAMLIRRDIAVRLPIVGDTALLADSAAPDGWRAALIAATGTSSCADGASAWRLLLSDAGPPIGGEVLVAEWLDVGLGPGATPSLAVRPFTSAAARQPAAGPLPSGATLTLLDASGTPLPVGSGDAAQLLELRVGDGRVLRVPVDRVGG